MDMKFNKINQCPVEKAANGVLINSKITRVCLGENMVNKPEMLLAKLSQAGDINYRRVFKKGIHLFQAQKRQGFTMDNRLGIKERGLEQIQSKSNLVLIEQMLRKPVDNLKSLWKKCVRYCQAPVFIVEKSRQELTELIIGKVISKITLPPVVGFATI
jgi:hypothetical protein